MNELPLVSVLIPVKNEEKNIIECLMSLSAQTLQCFEVIVVDDDSEDETLKLVEDYADERIRVVRNPGKGKVSAFNYGFSLSRGETVVFLGGDDVLPTTSLEVRVKSISPSLPLKNRVCAFGQLVMISEDKKFDGIKKPKIGRNGCESGGTLILSRSLANVVFPIPEQLPNEDTWTKLCVRHCCDSVVHINETVLFYRIHGGNSHSRYADFHSMNSFFHNRYVAYELFGEIKAESLGSNALKYVAGMAELEAMRNEGKSFRILFLGKAPITARLSFFFNSSPFWYQLKIRLMSFFR